MIVHLRVVAIAAAVCACCAAASAQPRRPAPRPATSPSRTTVLGYGIVGWRTLTASESFKAVAGTNQRILAGGGGQVMNIWKRLFVDGAFSQTSLDGERVFAANGEVFRLGIPLRIVIRPIDIAAGWRAGRGRVTSYAGGGAAIVSYKETSDLSESGDEVSEVRAGPLLLGGVDYAVVRWVRVGGEVRYRSVSGILGKGGVSQAFDEKMLGAFDAGVRVSFGR